MEFTTQLHWRPTIGDPTAMGWFTVVAYALGAVLTGLAALAHIRHGSGRGRAIWLLVTAGMAFLCVNKQLDLQSLLTEIGRMIARSQGWYAQRREFQKWLVLVIFAAAGLCAGWSILHFRAFWMAHRLLMTGVMFLITFIVVRAVSFHHFDLLLRTTVLGFRINWALELTGIFLIILAASVELLGRGPCSASIPVIVTERSPR